MERGAGRAGQTCQPGPTLIRWRLDQPSPGTVCFVVSTLSSLRIVILMVFFAMCLRTPFQP